MKTYDRDTYVRACAAWEDGEFGSEWAEVRRISWEHGFPFPPVGTSFDQFDDDQPSQRAIVYQWLDWRPSDTTRIVAQSTSWFEVVRKLAALGERVRDDANLADKDAAWAKAQLPTAREASAAIASTFERVASSLGYVKADER